MPWQTMAKRQFKLAYYWMKAESQIAAPSLRMRTPLAWVVRPTQCTTPRPGAVFGQHSDGTSKSYHSTPAADIMFLDQI